MKMTKAKIAELDRMSQEGYEIKRMARELEVTPTTIRYHLTKLADEQAEEPESQPDDRPEQSSNQRSPQDAPSSLDTARSERGRTVLWNILHDPASPPQAKVQAFRELSESERWGLDEDMQRRLPPPLTKDELIERQLELLRSLSYPILAEVVDRLAQWLATTDAEFTLEIKRSGD